jgi:hypothetical protein
LDDVSLCYEQETPKQSAPVDPHISMIVVIPNATHSVLLDRAERGRRMLLDEIMNFLRNDATAKH